MNSQNQPPNGPAKPPSGLGWVIVALLALFLLPLFASLADRTAPSTDEVAYSAFKQLVRDRLIERVVMRGSEIEAFRLDAPGAPAGAAVRTITTIAPQVGDPELLPLLEKHGVEITNERESDGNFLMSLIPWLVIIGVWLLILNRSQGLSGMGGPLTGRFKDFLGGPARRADAAAKRVTFADVAGQENAKKEVSELVDFLKDPERFRVVGAEPPRGVLLMGPPGTGKTLLARALAGEADVPFFSTSASEFIEVFVGVGASRVRAMFDEAKKRAPSIIFIDELNSVGRARGTGFGGGNDEREQTLDQILAELDGFTGREAVVVLAATNRPDVLDPALLRPGRFDRHVTLSLPNLTERAQILAVHTKKVPLETQVDLDVVAASTPGFSGADLKNLVNEAAINAARGSAKTVSMAHFDEARDKIMMGTVRTLAIQPDEKHRLSVHEAGHTCVAHHLPLADPVYKVTIIPRGRALGGTHMLPEEERHTLTEDYLKTNMAVMLGGRAAEETLLGSVSSGADEDIRQATQLARAMVARWGMSEEIGPVDLRDSDDHPFLGREMAQPRRFADETAAKVDEAVRKLVLAAEEDARRIIDSHRPAIVRLIDGLEREETLDKEEIEECLGPRRKPPASVSVIA